MLRGFKARLGVVKEGRAGRMLICKSLKPLVSRAVTWCQPTRSSSGWQSTSQRANDSVFRGRSASMPHARKRLV